MRAALVVVLCACRIAFDPLANVDAPSPGAPSTLTFGERPTSQRQGVTSDAYIDEGMPTLNRGGTGDVSLSAFNFDADHGLLRFDVSSIAPGTQISGARVYVTRKDNGDEVLGPVEIRLLDENWIEGTSALGSGTSWTTRDGTTSWTTPGGTTAQTLATFTPETLEIAVDLPVDIVRRWIDAPGTNAGLLFVAGAPGTHMHFHSRESTLDPAARPELAVDLTPE